MGLRLFVRHAAHDLVDHVLVGRMSRVSLSETGHRQAAALADRLVRTRMTRLQSSPQQRALETAAAIAERASIPVETCPALDEVDFGSWSGRTFAELTDDPGWRKWNEARDAARTPSGETMAGIQSRIVRHLEELEKKDPGGHVIMVTHAEIIRAALLHIRNWPIAHWSRITVPPAGITVLRHRSGRRESAADSGQAAA